MTHRMPNPRTRYFICTLLADAADLKYLISTKQKSPISINEYASEVFRNMLEIWTMDIEAWESITGRDWPGMNEVEIEVVHIKDQIAQSLISTRAFTCHNEIDLEGYDAK